MPINLSDYTKDIKAALKRRAFCCVWVGGIESPTGSLSRIGYSEDLAVAVERLQRTLPTPVKIDSALWVPDKAIAMVVAKAVQCDLAPNRRPGGWFETPADQATLALGIAFVRIYPSATMIWHESLMAHWQGR